jgi:hypothetical protein
MSLALVHSRARAGVDAPLVRVEVHLSGGLPVTQIVGLAETSVRESRERVRAALLCARFDFPQRRITLNLAPADLPKEGGRYDLAIALGILAASGQVDPQSLLQYEFLGELGLTGELRPVAGALPAAIAAAEAGRILVVPPGNAAEAALAEHADVRVARTLLECCAGWAIRACCRPWSAWTRHRCHCPIWPTCAGRRMRRVGSGCRRWAPSVVDRQSWLRQDAAGFAPAQPVAGYRGSRGVAAGRDCIGEWRRTGPATVAAAALPGTASVPVAALVGGQPALPR